MLVQVAERVLIIQKPFMERRSFATVSKVASPSLASPTNTCSLQPHKHL